MDYKRREIPNAVPIILMLTGLLASWSVLLYRLAAIVLIGGSFLMAAKLTDGEIPGGDFKLLCALTLSAGAPIVLICLLLCSLEALTVGIMKRIGGANRHIPLCTYVVPAYVIACFIIYII